MFIEKREFGILKNGSKVYAYELKNEELKIEILNYGGIITKVIQKSRDGIEENVVLGFSNIENYEERSPFFGCITGRVAGRIEKARFEIDGNEYKLPVNSMGNCIHGGIENLSKRIWAVEEIEDGIELSYFSKDLEEGFPGNVNLRVRYTLNGNKLKIEYRGATDRKTYLNLTNHTYFNLSGGRERVYNHELFIDSDYFLRLDETGIPTGVERSVIGTPFDMRNSNSLSKIVDEIDEDLKIVGGGIDHPYVLKKEIEGEMNLYHEKSGRRLSVRTSEPSVVVYTGNHLGKEGILSNGAESGKHMGICLETQDFPNAVNKREDKVRYITPEKEYSTFTEYIFSIE